MARPTKKQQAYKTAHPRKDGLPWQGFALVGDRLNPDTWFWPHHKSADSIDRNGRHKSVDWLKVEGIIATLWPTGELRQVEISAEDALAVAEHLAEHYRYVGRPIPDKLAVIV